MLRVAIAFLCVVVSSAAHAHHRRHHHHHIARQASPIESAVTAVLEAPARILQDLVRPMKLAGELLLDGKAFRFVSGGEGRWSIPYGDHEVTPDEVGSWGRRHGAIGLAGGEIWDPQLHRTREGIEIHPSTLYSTHGCVGIDRRQWPEFKRRLEAMLAMGHAWLHVTPAGVTITPTKEPRTIVAFADLA